MLINGVTIEAGQPVLVDVKDGDYLLRQNRAVQHQPAEQELNQHALILKRRGQAVAAQRAELEHQVIGKALDEALAQVAAAEQELSELRAHLSEAQRQSLATAENGAQLAGVGVAQLGAAAKKLHADRQAADMVCAELERRIAEQEDTVRLLQRGVQEGRGQLIQRALQNCAKKALPAATELIRVADELQRLGSLDGANVEHYQWLLTTANRLRSAPIL